MKAKQPTTASEHASAASKFLNIQSLFLFLIFPLCMIINVFLLTQYVNAVYEVPVPAFWAIAAALLFFLILAIYIAQRQYSKKHTKKSYQELLNMQQYQKKHYELIQQQRERLENIKNDFEHQLTDIVSLLDAEQTQEALTLLQTLTKDIESTKEYPYCPNPIINAVLSNKERVCKEHQIAFHADMQIGSCGSVEKLHLCSIFANLLDNAIEACKKLAPPTARYIDLTAKQTGNYLHIKVKNPSLPPISSRKGHGYGQKILSDIAAKYSGSFRTEYEKQTYEAYLSIQMP